MPPNYWRSPEIHFRGSPGSKVSLKKCDARCFTSSAIFALCPAYSLTTFQEFFRPFEEKESNRKNGVFPLKLVLKVGNRVGKLFLCKEKGTQILV
jgi:hypothetical protein